MAVIAIENDVRIVRPYGPLSHVDLITRYELTLHMFHYILPVIKPNSPARIAFSTSR